MPFRLTRSGPKKATALKRVGAMKTPSSSIKKVLKRVGGIKSPISSVKTVDKMAKLKGIAKRWKEDLASRKMKYEEVRRMKKEVNEQILNRRKTDTATTMSKLKRWGEQVGSPRHSHSKRVESTTFGGSDRSIDELGPKEYDPYQLNSFLKAAVENLQSNYEADLVKVVEIIENLEAAESQKMKIVEEGEVEKHTHEY